MKSNIEILNEIKSRMTFEAEFNGVEGNARFDALRDLFNAVATEEERKDFYTDLRNKLA